MGTIIECSAQILFSSIRKFLPLGVKETQYRIWYAVILLNLTGCDHREKSVYPGIDCDIHWVWLGRAVKKEDRELSGWVCRRKGVVAVIGFWLTAAGATCIWLDWTLAHPQAAVHITEHTPLSLPHTHTLLFALPLSVLVILCLSPYLSVSPLPTLFSAYLSPPVSLFSFPLYLYFLCLFFSSLRFFCVFFSTATQQSFLSKASPCTPCKFLQWVIPIGAPWTFALSRPFQSRHCRSIYCNRTRLFLMQNKHDSVDGWNVSQTNGFLALVVPWLWHTLHALLPCCL